MSKRNKKKAKPLYETVRNWVLVAAHECTGGGSHGDRRTKRKRTRGDQKRAAIQDYC